MKDEDVVREDADGERYECKFVCDCLRVKNLDLTMGYNIEIYLLLPMRKSPISLLQNHLLKLHP